MIAIRTIIIGFAMMVFLHTAMVEDAVAQSNNSEQVTIPVEKRAEKEKPEADKKAADKKDDAKDAGDSKKADAKDKPEADKKAADKKDDSKDADEKKKADTKDKPETDKKAADKKDDAKDAGDSKKADTKDKPEADRKAAEKKDDSKDADEKKKADTKDKPEADRKAAEKKDDSKDADEKKKADTKDKPEADKKAADKKDEKSALTIASWGGAYTKSQDLAYFKPFSKQTDIAIKTSIHKGSFETLTSKNSGEPDWDVVDISLEALNTACEDGLLEAIDPSILEAAPDGTPADKDYIANGLQKCGVASMAWSTAIVFDKRVFKKRTPDSLADFFNLKKFPGKRALLKSAKYNLELALMADGVKPDKVYEVLETEEGIDQALKKLDQIKKDIVWWEKGHEPLRLLARNTVSMATAYNGRIFVGIAGRNQPFGIIWDGQILNLDLWAIPKSSKNKTKAFKFVKFATQSAQLAEQTKWFPYGPMRKSALPMIGNHAEVGIDMKPFIPTANGNLKRALPHDPAWWEKNRSKIEQRFARWLEKKDEEPENTAEEDEKKKNKN